MGLEIVSGYDIVGQPPGMPAAVWQGLQNAAKAYSGMNIPGVHQGAAGGLVPAWAPGTHFAAPGAVVAQAAPAQVLAVGPHGNLQESRPHGHMKRQNAGIGVNVIPPGTLMTVTVRVQRIYRADRLILNSSLQLASGVVVQNIQIAQKSQFVSAGGLPIQAFFPTSFDASIRYDTARPGIDIIMDLLNTGIAADTVTGAFYGEAIDE